MGGSVGINVAAAVETARRLGPGHRIVTVLCDSGDRYRSRLYDRDWLAGRGLQQPDCDGAQFRSLATPSIPDVGSPCSAGGWPG